MFKCIKTKKEFKSYRGLLNHLRNEYDSLESAYIFENNKNIEYCNYCNKHLKFKSFKDGFYQHCGDRKCIKNHLKKSNSLIAKKLINKKMKIDKNLIKFIRNIDKKLFKTKNVNITILNTNTNNITLNQFLSKNFIKFERKCKYCSTLFKLPFNNLSKHHCDSKTCTQLFRNGYFTIRNKMSNKELNNKWFSLYALYGDNKANKYIKNYMKSPHDFDNIYCGMGSKYINIDGWQFWSSGKNNQLLQFIKINIDEYKWNHLVYVYCKNCGNLADTNKSLIKFNTKKFCSHKCYINYKITHSSEFPYLDETKYKQSNTLKNKILHGTFTPKATNSWCKSRVHYKDFKFRSSWEFLFFLLNESTDLLFEQLRIPYVFENKQYVYIVDFINNHTKNVFEIKPNSEKDTLINRAKEEALKNWCKHNNFSFNLITEDYFLNQDISKNQKKIIEDLGLSKKLNKIVK